MRRSRSFLLLPLLMLFAGPARAGTTANLVMSVDTPLQGATTTSSFLVGGWAIDLNSTSGPGVDAVHIWAYPRPGSNILPIFLGAATLNGYRPDVATAFGSQAFTNAGYNFMTTAVSLETYDLVVYVRATGAAEFAQHTVVRINYAPGDVPVTKRVGIVYFDHAPAAKAMNLLNGMPETTEFPKTRTVEEVVRSGGELGINNMLLTTLPLTEAQQIPLEWRTTPDEGYASLLSYARSYHYHLTPVGENLVTPNYYCLYTPRPGETGIYPSCDNEGVTTTTLERHARLLREAKVDFVIMDGSNKYHYDSTSRLQAQLDAEVIQVRPAEVLFEKWDALRRNNQWTPEIAVFANLQTGANLFRKYLDLYNNPAYATLVMRDRATKKKVFFAVAGADPSLKAEIESNYNPATSLNRNDIVVIEMWANLDSPQRASGVWAWGGACLEDGKWTTSVIGRSCNQGVTTNSPIGPNHTQMSVSVSMQLEHASRAFQATGILGGETFRKQFATAFATQPDYLVINGWNEFATQPRFVNTKNEPALTPRAVSMGLETDRLMYGYSPMWTDAFGAEYARVIEPSVELSDTAYRLMKDCLQIFRTPSTTCSEPANSCCSLPVRYRNIFSLRVAGGQRLTQDHMLTTSESEKTNLVITMAWIELGANYGTLTSQHVPPQTTPVGSTTFPNEEAADPYRAGEGGWDALNHDGPFILFETGGTNREPLYRCRTSDIGSGGPHLFSRTQGCDGRIDEGVLGYVSTVKTTETPRRLLACKNETANVYFHWLSGDTACPAGSVVVGPPEGLGYVK